MRFFIAVAEHRHFGNAAASLAMAQPPLSQGIQRLERHLGQRLFDRDARRVALTPSGAALLPEARELVGQADTFVETARGWTDDVVVRVGLSPDLDDYAGRVMAHLAAADVHISPRLAGSNELLGELREGDLDIALVRHPSPVDGLLAGDVLTVRGTIDADALERGAPVVLPPRAHHPAAHDQIVDHLHRLGFDNPVREIELHQERQAWIAAGMGTGITRGVADSQDTHNSAQIPMRFRVVVPVITEQRPGIDHARLSRLIETAMR
nr:LysR family transcriptional regulator [Kineosphaera limosa]